MGDERVLVSFTCQRCLQPIKIDETFDRIDEHKLAELSHVDLESQAMSFDQFVPPFGFRDSGAANFEAFRRIRDGSGKVLTQYAVYGTGTNGFMLISDVWDNDVGSHKMKVKAELFDKLSSNSEIDHPLCDECTDTLLEMMDQQLKLADNDFNDYLSYLKKLEASEDVPDIEQLEKELADLSTEEERLVAELAMLKTQEEAIKVSIEGQQAEQERLRDEQVKYWREYTKHRRDLMATEDEFRSVENHLAYAQSQLDRLKKTNVFNVTFHIWHSGHFGTINNFRLGRLPSAPVDWSEINAAWGQTALLLSALARKMNLTFKRYKLVPYGNHSYIEEFETGKQLPLYGTGGIRFYWDTKFDAAMVAFLDCLQQFKDEVEKGDSGFCLPYKMDKGKIEDSATGNSYSIKIQFNSEEQWTKALKFLLTNLKWGLAWVSSQFADDKLDD
ncbi:beclin-1-like protein isoform X2 [Lutzomyia longipalpis]|uniref:beclin-1-like protein isoform X2 n=1 Tax=Lutzomyia longipalpis TaxID=7200 RepID=UPI0024839EF9|nr:beclin-1-like protein isoform X2 [Lutzomyia longipalpis]